MKAKRILLLTVAALALLSVSSCTKRYYEEYYIEGDGVQMKQIDFTIRSTDWEVQELDGGACLIYRQLDVPQITSNVVNYGDVTVSRKLKDANGNVVWTPLPCVRAQYMDYGTVDEYLYSTYLDFEWGLGYVMVFYTATDFKLDEEGDPAMDLRVTVWQYEEKDNSRR